QQLERDSTIELRVVGRVDGSGATRADPLDDEVATDHGPLMDARVFESVAFRRLGAQRCRAVAVAHRHSAWTITLSPCNTPAYLSVTRTYTLLAASMVVDVTGP